MNNQTFVWWKANGYEQMSTIGSDGYSLSMVNAEHVLEGVASCVGVGNNNDRDLWFYISTIGIDLFSVMGDYSYIGHIG